jgi:hypothetical protein
MSFKRFLCRATLNQALGDHEKQLNIAEPLSKALSGLNKDL